MQLQYICRKHSHLNLVLCNNWTYIKPHFTEMVPFQIDSQDISWKLILWLWRQHKLIEEHVNLSDINYLKNIFISINKIIYKCSPLIKIIFEQVMGNANHLAMWDKKSKTLNFIGKWKNVILMKFDFTEMVPFQIDSQDLRSRWPLLLKIVFFIFHYSFISNIYCSCMTISSSTLQLQIKLSWFWFQTKQ
jgi:hypothetical protein